jgi:3-oxoadipate enol-lactonase
VGLHFRFEGAADRPVLVLLHSLGTNLSMWDRVAETLTTDYRILRVDLRGHGGSQVPPGPYRLADYCDDLFALLDALRLSRVHLAGISLGGMIAMGCAIRDPGRTGRLILANTAACIGTSNGWNARIAQVHAVGMTQLAAGAGEVWFTQAFREAHAEEVGRFTQMLSTCSLEGYTASCAALRDADLSQQLSGIVSPVLVVAGSGDAVTTPADAAALQQGIPDASCLELPAAHLSAAELPDEFSSAVQSFLREEHPYG